MELTSESRPKKVRQSRNIVNLTLVVFFNNESVEHAPRAQAINKEYDVEDLKGLRDAV